ncbi:hypothetical protein EST38_g8621 [Candolleomyces aberdarensis]|uniref:G domain-containing protein n=1 Tax=Candolleomyces aberdarensis TaxID=2316362 RepID=A0A4Q2DFG7_9AGAR|nr:hypothetical protein EST38_g8621 [Candolleomyces aberdarensis]
MTAETKKKLTKDSGILILLVGLTGAGKSHFINVLAGTQNTAPEGDSLTPKTGEVGHYVVEAPLGSGGGTPQKLILVDTPGFDGETSGGGDAAVLVNIFKWLTEHCDGIRLGGIIYFHPLTHDRGAVHYIKIKEANPGEVHETSLMRYLRGFATRLGQNRLMLVTTKWESATQWKEDFTKRHDRMSEVWKPLVDAGATIWRFPDNLGSAELIIQNLVKQETLPLSRIQGPPSQESSTHKRAVDWSCGLLVNK